MSRASVKLPASAHATLVEMAAEDDRPIGEILAAMIERERRRRMFEAADAAYARLRDDPEAWADWQAELRSMEGSLLDGLRDDPWRE